MSGNEELTAEDIQRAKEYLAQAEKDIQQGKKVSKSAFQEFLEHLGLHRLIEKLSELWDWILEKLNDMFP